MFFPICRWSLSTSIRRRNLANGTTRLRCIRTTDCLRTHTRHRSARAVRIEPLEANERIATIYCSYGIAPLTARATLNAATRARSDSRSSPFLAPMTRLGAVFPDRAPLGAAEVLPVLRPFRLDNAPSRVHEIVGNRSRFPLQLNARLRLFHGVNFLDAHVAR